MSASLWQRAISWQSLMRALGWLLQGDELGYFAFGGSTVIAVFATEAESQSMRTCCTIGVSLPYEAEHRMLTS